MRSVLLVVACLEEELPWNSKLDRTAAGLERLREFEAEWIEVEPSIAVRETACRLLRAHPLRTADALQLSAALRLSDELGGPIDIVCFDDRLADAARSERLRVINGLPER